MKRILIALLLGVSLVSCGAKREVESIVNSDWSNADYFFNEEGYNKDEVMDLIKKDIEKADNMYDGYTTIIKTDNYIITYRVLDIEDNNYQIYLFGVYHGDKEYIDGVYEIEKEVFEEVFK